MARRRGTPTEKVLSQKNLEDSRSFHTPRSRNLPRSFKRKRREGGRSRRRLPSVERQPYGRRRKLTQKLGKMFGKGEENGHVDEQERKKKKKKKKKKKEKYDRGKRPKKTSSS